jgi:predicted nuclease of restriction endonuclease-like RecB superfamily
VRVDGKLRERALSIAQDVLAVLAAHVGRTREELDDALGRIDAAPSDRKVLLGLRKLAEDACTFDATEADDAVALRQEVFVLATETRRALAIDGAFDRNAVLGAIATTRNTDVASIERALFADLRSAQLLRAAPEMGAATLVAKWELGQAQAVLLRAVRVRVDVWCASAGALRALFHRLKFLRLLYTVSAQDDFHRIEIDGPFSLFDAVTKYGLQLAMMLPALRECARYRLEAEVRWGQTRETLVFRAEGEHAGHATVDDARLPDDVDALVTAIRALDCGWKVRVAQRIFDLPGVGLCVPDLELRRESDGALVHLEVMGYWSRDAVWRRVELVQQGLPQKILFAVSDRLRVSAEVLGADLPGALYVYKGKMSARSVIEHVERLAGSTRGS